MLRSITSYLHSLIIVPLLLIKIILNQALKMTSIAEEEDGRLVIFPERSKLGTAKMPGKLVLF